MPSALVREFLYATYGVNAMFWLVLGGTGGHARCERKNGGDAALTPPPRSDTVARCPTTATVDPTTKRGADFKEEFP